MKTAIKWLVVLLVLAAIAVGVIGVIVVRENKPAAEKISDEAKDAAASAKVVVSDAVKAGTEAVGEVATNVAGEVATGVQKADAVATNVEAKAEMVATNVAAKVKTATTNAVGEVKQKFDDLTH